MSRLTSIRLSVLTDNQLSELASRFDTTKSDIISLAIDRMYQQENRTMTTQQQVYGVCGKGQSIYDVLRELQADGSVPQNATTGDRYGYGDEANDSTIIGHITVRRNEMYAIKVRS